MKRLARGIIQHSSGLAIPLTLVAVGFLTDIVLDNRRAEVEFQAKVAEVVLNSETPYQAHGRAVAFKSLFPGRLPKDFAEKFDPELVDQDASPQEELTVAAKKELIRLLAENPEQAKLILSTWAALLPEDEWANEVKDALFE